MQEGHYTSTCSYWDMVPWGSLMAIYSSKRVLDILDHAFLIGHCSQTLPIVTMGQYDYAGAQAFITKVKHSKLVMTVSVERGWNILFWFHNLEKGYP